MVLLKSYLVCRQWKERLQKKSERSKELVEIVRCKNCIHRPIKGEDTHDIDPPQNSRGYVDYTCPCLNEDDYWYSWYPSDEWFCANGEVKGDENGIHEN